MNVSLYTWVLSKRRILSLNKLPRVSGRQNEWINPKEGIIIIEESQDNHFFFIHTCTWYYNTNNIHGIIQRKFILDIRMQCYATVFLNNYLLGAHYILGTLTYIISSNPYNNSLREAYKQSETQKE